MLEETVAMLKASGWSWEVVVVDDGSKDETVKVVQQIATEQQVEEIRVLMLDRNCGKGGAIQKGMLRARGERILMADADGATAIDDLRLLMECMDQGADIAVGSRAHMEQQSIAKRTWYRTVLMRVFHFWVSLWGPSGVRDTQCGFKLFDKRAAQQLFVNQRLRRWAFDVELLLLAEYTDLSVSEVAVHWHEVPGSKLNLIKASLEMARDLVVIRMCYALGLWDIRRL